MIFVTNHIPYLRGLSDSFFQKLHWFCTAAKLFHQVIWERTKQTLRPLYMTALLNAYIFDVLPWGKTKNANKLLRMRSTNWRSTLTIRQCNLFFATKPYDETHSEIIKGYEKDPSSLFNDQIRFWGIATHENEKVTKIGNSLLFESIDEVLFKIQIAGVFGNHLWLQHSRSIDTFVPCRFTQAF